MRSETEKGKLKDQNSHQEVELVGPGFEQGFLFSRLWHENTKANRFRLNSAPFLDYSRLFSFDLMPKYHKQSKKKDEYTNVYE